MDLSIFLKKGFKLRMQRPGLLKTAILPLTTCSATDTRNLSLVAPTSPACSLGATRSPSCIRRAADHLAFPCWTPIIMAKDRPNPATIGLVAHG
jgi:hypothetical protein